MKRRSASFDARWPTDWAARGLDKGKLGAATGWALQESKKRIRGSACPSAPKALANSWSPFNL